MAVIGYATLPIIPSFRGIQAQLAQGLAGPAAAAGLAGGREAGQSFSSGLGTATASMTSVGQKMTTAVSLPVAAIGAAALKMGGDFQASMKNVQAVTGASGTELEKMSSVAKELGASTSFSASEAADALGFLGMAGFSATQSTKALPGVLDLAAASGMELADTADIASNILSGFALEVDQMGRVGDVLAKTASSANVNVSMLGESFKYVAPTASAAGLSIEETSAAIGLLGNAGIQGSEAGTALNSAIGMLLAPSGKAAAKLSELGVQTTDSGGKLRSLTDILSDLESGGADVTDMIEIFGVETGPKMQALLSQGSGALSDLTGDLENAGGTAKEMADIKMEGFKGGLKELQSAFEGLMIAIAESGLLKWATSFVGKVTELTQAATGANPQLLKWGLILAGAAAILGPLTVVAAKVITAVGTIGRAAASTGRAVATAAGGTTRFTKGLVGGTSALGTNATAAGRAGAAVRGFSDTVRLGASAAASGAKNLLKLAGQYTLVGLKAAGAAAKTAAFKIGSLAAQAASAAAGMAKLAASYALVGLRAAGAAAKTLLLKTAQLAVKAATLVWTGVQWALNAAMSANPIGLIIIAIVALVAAFVLAWKKSETFRSIVMGVLNAVGAVFVWLWQNAILPLWNGIKFLFQWVVDNWKLLLAVLTGPIGIAVGLIVKYWDKIKAWFHKGIEFVKSVVQSGISKVRSIWQTLSSLPGKIARWFGQAYEWVKEKLSAIVDWVKGLPGKISSGLSSLKRKFLAPFKAAFNALAGAWNSTIGSWEISVPDWVPEIGGSTWGMPNIPTLAEGGIVPATPGGRLAVVAEGGEDEAVIPLSKLDRLLSARSGPGQGVRVENMTVQAWSERFSLPQIQQELAAHGAV